MGENYVIEPKEVNGHEIVAGHHHLLRNGGTRLYSLEKTLQEKKALHMLTVALEQMKDGKELPEKTPFDDIIPSIWMEYHLVPSSDKYIVASEAIRYMGSNYVVYGAGIADDPSFEAYMYNNLKTDVHAFDCTVPFNSAAKWGLPFHSWCIGKPKDLHSSIYAKAVAGQNTTFFSLSELKQKLNHTHIDMLKVDVEGCEWDLLYDEIVNGKEEDLPCQLLFELHTEGANPTYVPKAIVQGKKRKQVDQLIVDLFKRNYRVFHLELNRGDHNCAEIGLFRI